MQRLRLTDCTGLTGDIGTLVLPEGMQELSLSRCTGLTGDTGTLVLPEGMQYLSLRGCIGLTGKVTQLLHDREKEAAVSKDKDGDAVKRKAQGVLWGTGDTASKRRQEGGRSVEQGLSSKDAMDKAKELASVGGVAPGAGHGADARAAGARAAGARAAGARAARAEAEEKEAAAGAVGKGGGGSRRRKTLPRMDPEEALHAFAESVGMPVDRMWRGVTEMWGGGVEIDWGFKGLEGTLPVGDMHMPYLRILKLGGNRELKGEARGVGVAVVKFTDCFCE